YLLKRAVDGLLPTEVVTRRKQGLGVPIAAWLRGPLRGVLEARLAPARVAWRGLFEPATVARLVAEHVSGRRHHRKIWWTLLMLAAWCDHYLPDERWHCPAAGISPAGGAAGGQRGPPLLRLRRTAVHDQRRDALSDDGARHRPERPLAPARDQRRSDAQQTAAPRVAHRDRRVADRRRDPADRTAAVAARRPRARGRDVLDRRAIVRGRRRPGRGADRRDDGGRLLARALARSGHDARARDRPDDRRLPHGRARRAPVGAARLLRPGRRRVLGQRPGRLPGPRGRAGLRGRSPPMGGPTTPPVAARNRRARPSGRELGVDGFIHRA